MKKKKENKLCGLTFLGIYYLIFYFIFYQFHPFFFVVTVSGANIRSKSNYNLFAMHVV